MFVSFVIALIFTTKDGFYWFDIWDKWICDFGLVTAGLAQCIIIGYLYNVQEFRRYLNSVSEIRLGNWWVIALRYVTPVVLVVILVTNLRSEILGTYQGYPRWATNLSGWGVLVAIAIVGYVLWRMRGTRSE